MAVILTVTGPGGKKDRHVLQAATEFTVGRNSDCSCRLESDHLVSRKHAVLFVDPPSVSIMDCGSTNGVVINGEVYGAGSERRPSQPRPLRDGDTVTIGASTIAIAVTDDSKNIAGGDVQPPPRESARSHAVADGRSATPASAPLPRTPGYALERRIGSGALSQVYLARNEKTGEKAAVKVMNPRIALNQRMIETFKQDIGVVKSLNHPNLVKLLDCDIVDDNTIYLAVEYVDGEDLLSRLGSTPGRRLPLPEAHSIALQIADGLAYAHRHGIVHRDIKSPNIILAENAADGKTITKISNLGLVKSFDEAGMQELANVAAWSGSLAYTPPEQIIDPRESRPTVDVFGAGAVIYEMISGAIPYDFTTSRDHVNIVASGEIVPAENRVPDLPETLAVIVNRCLLPDPDGRYQDCGALLEALRDIAF